MVQLTLYGFIDEGINKSNERTITKQLVASSCLPPAHCEWQNGEDPKATETKSEL